jgi:hypothetical protein
MTRSTPRHGWRRRAVKLPNLGNFGMAQTAQQIADAISENATGPRRVQVGTESVEQHSLKDQLAAHDRINAATAAQRKHFGLRFQKLVPPGGG